MTQDHVGRVCVTPLTRGWLWAFSLLSLRCGHLDVSYWSPVPAGSLSGIIPALRLDNWLITQYLTTAMLQATTQ